MVDIRRKPLIVCFLVAGLAIVAAGMFLARPGFATSRASAALSDAELARVFGGVEEDPVRCKIHRVDDCADPDQYCDSVCLESGGPGGGPPDPCPASLNEYMENPLDDARSSSENTKAVGDREYAECYRIHVCDSDSDPYEQCEAGICSPCSESYVCRQCANGPYSTQWSWQDSCSDP